MINLLQFKRFLLCALFGTFISCEESPLLSKKEALEQMGAINKERDPFHKITDMVATLNNDVYYFKRFDSIPKKITNTPGNVKTSVKLSFDKSLIAYINKNHNPEIIRVDNGQLVQTLTQYSYPSQIGFLKDRNTLFILQDGEVYFYGSAPNVTQPLLYHPYDNVSSFSMNSKGDQGYFVHHYNTSGFQLAFLSETENIDDYYSSYIEGFAYDYIDFYDNEGSFLLGARDYNDLWESIICMKDYQFYPSYEYSDELMDSPVFDSTSEVVIFSRKNETHYEIKAVYLGTEAYPPGLSDIMNKVLADYTSTTPISVGLSK